MKNKNVKKLKDFKKLVITKKGKKKLKGGIGNDDAVLD